MAMQKAIELSSGVVVNYHCILRVNNDYVSNPGKTLVTAEIGCYLDKESYDSGKLPVMTEIRTAIFDGHNISCEAIYQWLSQPIRKMWSMTPKSRDDGTIESVPIEIDDRTSITGFNGATLI